jgi:hypothetical protein
MNMVSYRPESKVQFYDVMKFIMVISRKILFEKYSNMFYLFLKCLFLQYLFKRGH